MTLEDHVTNVHSKIGAGHTNMTLLGAAIASAVSNGAPASLQTMFDNADAAWWAAHDAASDMLGECGEDAGLSATFIASMMAPKNPPPNPPEPPFG
ncbi:hypothetical protein [Stakelama tenebrarum]|uniref:Uncharacterized protein n=1 Tax=Stakelama tenebrarum TaxID=2711215 RepID=A0A6G6Y525_9SPHN|nr:hypothetical protein [Sphingosinithalassobacter tenebrarum]QIG79999.1 hypothetical protein G5C33_09565 [Sphingosinithalassobacter tenebrarum]